MTSCGCFECICGIEPFSNGGVQTPGFMGHGKHFIGSKKFMKAEGGIERIVWMPKELNATDPEELVAFLTEKNHPALSMDPMM